ncbi:hypothetical protein CEXT_208011 [Caerostris extrusa]|uniref:Uncharacterized protein n=1 Tax=Caerostris extrusa TaxID=172846 RepID=A0AAV4MNK6_CAEEX|nr:hypothetical protein CEXT_208011 [Caerostris extrusa]
MQSIPTLVWFKNNIVENLFRRKTNLRISYAWCPRNADNLLKEFSCASWCERKGLRTPVVLESCVAWLCVLECSMDRCRRSI